MGVRGKILGQRLQRLWNTTHLEPGFSHYRVSLLATPPGAQDGFRATSACLYREYRQRALAPHCGVPRSTPDTHNLVAQGP